MLQDLSIERPMPGRHLSIHPGEGVLDQDAAYLRRREPTGAGSTPTVTHSAHNEGDERSARRAPPIHIDAGCAGDAGWALANPR